MNGLRNCGIYAQWNFIQSQRRMKFYHSLENGWNRRTSSEANLDRLKKPKNLMFSLIHRL
jgi:hypothetical protein